MDLNEYLWRNNRTVIEFAKSSGCAIATINNVRQKHRTPTLKVAMRIRKESGNRIEFESMLSKTDQKEFTP